MKTTPSAPLGRYLSQKSRTGRPPNPTSYITQGAELVSPDDLSGLAGLLPQVKKKATGITDSERLRRRIDLLVLFFRETQAQGGTAERREIAFVLFYFLKGFDLIPDSIPQIGLLDDALLVETALNRNLAALRAHWAASQRVFPENP
jgi:uncharacterized membrane protein YkvA (DUF1232 family)